MRKVTDVIEKNNYYFGLLTRLMRSGEEVYLYGTDLKGLPIHFDCSNAEDFDGPDLMRSIITLRFVIENEEQYKKYTKFRYWRQWEERDDLVNFYIDPNSPNGQSLISGPTWPKCVTAKVPLKFISNVPFDGLPAGRLLYGKEDDT